jgi:hypothetical protein
MCKEETNFRSDEEGRHSCSRMSFIFQAFKKDLLFVSEITSQSPHFDAIIKGGFIFCGGRR